MCINPIKRITLFNKNTNVIYLKGFSLNIVTKKIKAPSILGLLISSVVAFFPVTSYSQTPPRPLTNFPATDLDPQPNVALGSNNWTLVAYRDNSAQHEVIIEHRICFFPMETEQRKVIGLWYASSFRGLRGRFAQEGDQIDMYGEYLDGRGHDAVTLEFAGKDEAFGKWIEWRTDGLFGRPIEFARIKAIRRPAPCLLSGYRESSPTIAYLNSLTSADRVRFRNLILGLSDNPGPPSLPLGTSYGDAPSDPMTSSSLPFPMPPSLSLPANSTNP
jgi:hypothetical protein